MESNAGRVLMVGLPGLDLDDPSRRKLQRLGPAGVVLFARNLETPDRAGCLLRDVVDVLPGRPLLALDQEGGRVSRLEPWVGPTPTAVEVARAGDDAARAFGRATALALRAVGFNVDFAPVVDLCGPQAGNGIDDRAFGPEPIVVCHRAGAFLDGLQSEGVAGCLKHFPGLGATCVDSHVDLPRDDREPAAIEAADLEPYRALGDRAAMVMVGHAHYPRLEPTAGRPATLSPRIVTGLLRQRLGFGGLVVSDDLEMGAVAPLDVDGAAAVAAIEAGCDLLLYCADLGRAEVALDALSSRAAADPSFAERLGNAAARVERTAAAWPAPVAGSEGWDRACALLRSASRRISRARDR